MRLFPLRRVQLMKPLAAALLLALLMPAQAWTAPEGENTTESAAPANPAPQAGSENNAATPDTSVRPVLSAPVAADEKPSLNIPEGGLALTPFLDFLLDPTGMLDISQVSAPERAQAFRRFEVRAPQRQAGTLWLRFRLGPASSASATASGPAQTRLDLGDQVPGKAQVWTRTGDHPPVPAEAQEDLFSLAGLAGGGDVFVRLDGLPGLWFAPALRTVSDSLTTPDRRAHPLLLAALTALLLLCLVRSVTERGDGRLWAGILTGAALLHALWGLPSTPRGTVMASDMPGLLAAGVALMLLPHVGRNIMHTRDRSPRLDVILLILALPGAALALLPLLPDLAWTARLFSLWPLGAALCLLPALVLLARGVQGSALFSLACLGLVAGGGLALWGVNGGLTAPLWGQAALAGIVFAVVLLAAAPRSALSYADDGADEGFLPDSENTNLLLLEDQSHQAAPSSQRLEEILRDPLDALLREACSLDQILDHPDDEHPLSNQDARQARQHTDNLVAAAREMSTLVSELPRLVQRRGTPESKRQVFDLLKLIQSVFADVSDTLQKGDLGLSWYIAPHLGRLYKGDRDRLRFVLSMLLENAARATDRGAVSLRVRRADMSPNPGHLQFTVTDTGSGTPPLRRSSLTLAKAWELAADHGGDLFVDSTPHGVEICFSLNCVALADDGLTPRPVPPALADDRRESGEANPRLVILASPQPLNRQMLAFFLEDQGQEIWEARDAEEAAALYAHSPAALVIFDGLLPEEDIVSAVASIRAFEGERSLPAAPFLALTLDEEQAGRLHQAGCDHSLPVPVARGEFRAMCLHLASPSGVKARPAVVPYRVPPARPHQLRTPPSPAAESGTEISAVSPLEDRPPSAHAATDRKSATAPANAMPDAGRAAPGGQAPVPAAPALSRNTATTQQYAPTLSPGLHLPPQPKKRLGWLSGLFKPTPHIAPSEPLEAVLPDTSTEWVGEPMPITPAPAATPGQMEDSPHDAPESGADTSITEPARGASARPDADSGPEAALSGQPENVPARTRDTDLPAAPSATFSAESPAEPDTAGETPAGENSAQSAQSTEDSDDRPAAPARNEAQRHMEDAAAGIAMSVSSDETAPVSAPVPPEKSACQTPAPHMPAKGRHKHSGKHKRRKNRMDTMPFLSLAPDITTVTPPVNDGKVPPAEPQHPAGPTPDSDDDVVELTEADMVDSPLLQQVPDLLRSLDAAVEHAGKALEQRNPRGLISAADRMADRAGAFGLHALSDLALCLKEAAQQGDFETSAQLLPELRAEVARHRHAG